MFLQQKARNIILFFRLVQNGGYTFFFDLVFIFRTFYQETIPTIE